MPLDFARTRTLLQQFDFHRLFIEELGWSQPTRRKPTDVAVADATVTFREIAQLAGVAVFEVSSPDGSIPDARARAAIHKGIAEHHHENLLIFVDADRTQSLWYWVKRQQGKAYPRPGV